MPGRSVVASTLARLRSVLAQVLSISGVLPGLRLLPRSSLGAVSPPPPLWLDCLDIPRSVGSASVGFRHGFAPNKMSLDLSHGRNTEFTLATSLPPARRSRPSVRPDGCAVPSASLPAIVTGSRRMRPSAPSAIASPAKQRMCRARTAMAHSAHAAAGFDVSLGERARLHEVCASPVCVCQCEAWVAELGRGRA